MSLNDNFTVTNLTRSVRIDKYLTKRYADISRSHIQYLISSNQILVNDEPTKPNYKVKIDDVITIEEHVETQRLEAVNLPLDIVYQDDDIAVINKENGRVVHPGAGNPTNTLVNALLYHIDDFQATKGDIRPGIVHRIDKETTGLLVVAKHPKAHENVSKQLKNKTAYRQYIALVEGVIPHNKGKVNAPIGRNPKKRQQMGVNAKGKDAVTHFSVLKRYSNNTLIECKLETGRTHQIRVHMQYIGYPIVGDPTYGYRKTDKTYGQYLHASTLRFIHPTTNEEMEFHAPLPTFFTDYLATLEEDVT